MRWLFIIVSLLEILSHQLALLYRTWSEEDEGDVVLHVVVLNMQQQLGGDYLL